MKFCLFIYASSYIAFRHIVHNTLPLWAHLLVAWRLVLGVDLMLSVVLVLQRKRLVDLKRDWASGPIFFYKKYQQKPVH
jgi:hypothetical protein